MLKQKQRIYLFFLLVFCGIIQMAEAQIVNGFQNRLDGAVMDYHSPHPQATRALIVRATDGQMSIKWQSAELPETSESEIQILWLAGLGCNLGLADFTLWVNNRYALTFKTWNKEQWKVKHSTGLQLQFKTLMVDKYGDRMGIMTLTVPAGLFPAHQPLTLTVRGGANHSQAWVMTFMFPLKEEVTVLQRPALVKRNGKLWQPVKIIFTHLGVPDSVQLSIGKKSWQKFANYGINQYQVFLPQVSRPVEQRLTITLGTEKMVQYFQQTPVRPWVLYLVQHTHTDIGYTRPQQEILAEHLRYIDLALDLCDQTDDYPDAAKFRWTCEASWPVKEFLQARPPEQIARLRKRVLEGRIELTAMMFNLSDMVDENLLVGSLQPLKTIQANGLPVKTAMQNDVTGFAWQALEYLAGLGIRYISMGPNTHRALKPFKHPTLFYWLSPSGKPLLAFRGEHYMTANFVSQQNGELASVENELFAFLYQLEKSGYSYNRIALQFSGYYTDNAPPSSFACEIIKKWNETYAYPQLRTATVSEFLQYAEKHYANQLPKYQAAWPDWWMDGFASAPRETGVARQTQANLLNTQGVMALVHLLGGKVPQNLLAELNDVQEQLLFYAEHTFGADESIRNPLSENSINQWMIKASFAWQAQWKNYLLQQKALAFLTPFLTKSHGPTIYVLNTLNHPRSGYVTVYIDKQWAPPDQEIVGQDKDGTQTTLQLVKQRAEGNYWCFFAQNIPPMGWKKFTLHVLPASQEQVAPQPSTVLENRFYRLELDLKRGTVSRLWDKELGVELVDSQAEWGFAQFIYERLSDRHALELYRKGNMDRSTLKNVKVTSRTHSQLWDALTLTGENESAQPLTSVEVEIRLFHQQKRIDFIYRLIKKRQRNAEAIYLAFPLYVPKGEVVFETQGALVHAGKNQLPGSANDWNGFQNFIAVKNRAFQVVLSSPDCPLVQIGGINTGRFQPTAQPVSPHLYFWPLNNYWTTNFKDSEEGALSWQISLTSSSDLSPHWASDFGGQIRVPLIPLLLPPAKTGTVTQKLVSDRSFYEWPFNQENVLGIPLKPLPKENGVLFLVRELDGHLTRLIESNAFVFFESDALGNKSKRTKEVVLAPFETKFVIVKKAGK